MKLRLKCFNRVDGYTKGKNSVYNLKLYVLSFDPTVTLRWEQSFRIPRQKFR